MICEEIHAGSSSRTNSLGGGGGGDRDIVKPAKKKTKTSKKGDEGKAKPLPGTLATGEGQRKTPPEVLAATAAKVNAQQPKSPTTGQGTYLLTNQEKKEKERFLMFTRVLMK